MGMTDFFSKRAIYSMGDLVFKASGYAFRFFYKATGIRPSSRPYVSGDSFRALADWVLDYGGKLDGSSVKEGDVVFINADVVPYFMEQVLPAIRNSFVLVSHNGDRNIDASYAALADDPRVVAWFAQNAIVRHPKIIPLPIGLENRKKHNNGIVRDYDRLRRHPVEKAMKILYAFNVRTNRAEREPALDAMRSMPLAESPRWTVSRAYRASLAGYCFTLSPPGNGFDCHRTWEALYLGVIPIVKRSPFFDAFPGLPALFVDDWREAAGWSEDTLRSAYDELSPKIDSCPYLWMEYWEKRIEDCRHSGGEA
jgi:hypothetical protein